MRILDKNDQEVLSPDLSLGYLKEEKRFVMRHEAVPEVPAVIERKITRYPNGGVDIDPVVVSPAIPGEDAWDEYEQILRYLAYTPEELEAMEQKRQQDEASAPVSREVYERKILELEQTIEMLLQGVTSDG